MRKQKLTKQAVMSVRIDENMKDNFDHFCTQVGMTSSAAVNMFVAAVLREKRIPFEITTEPGTAARASVRRAIRETEEELMDGGLKSYDSADEMLKDMTK